MQITTIGLDLAKNVFQVHGVDATAFLLARANLSFLPSLPNLLPSSHSTNPLTANRFLQAEPTWIRSSFRRPMSFA